MTNYSGVDTVYISGHRFIPVGEVFYEVVIEGKFPLYIQHSGKVQSPPKPAAYGGTSEVSSASYINNISLGNDVYRLKNDPEVRIKADKTYYTLMGGEWVIIRSMKNLAKLAGLETDAFLKYIKEKNLKFENPADVIAAAEYCNR
jgi:hypothetical protein